MLTAAQRQNVFEVTRRIQDGDLIWINDAAGVPQRDITVTDPLQVPDRPSVTVMPRDQTCHSRSHRSGHCIRYVHVHDARCSSAAGEAGHYGERIPSSTCARQGVELTRQGVELCRPIFHGPSMAANDCCCSLLHVHSNEGAPARPSRCTGNSATSFVSGRKKMHLTKRDKRNKERPNGTDQIKEDNASGTHAAPY